MVRSFIGLALALSLLAPTLVALDGPQPQNPGNRSLADLARQERERQKNQAPSKAVLTNDGSTRPGPSAGQGSIAPRNPAGIPTPGCKAPCVLAFPVPGLGKVVMDISADGRWLALAQYQAANKSFSQVSIRDMKTGNEVRRIQTPLRSVTTVRFSSDGKVLATGGSTLGLPVEFLQYTKLPEAAAQAGGLALLWGVDDGRAIWTLDGDPFVATALAFSPDGRTIVTGGETGAIRAWNAATGHQLYPLASPARDWQILKSEGRTPVASIAFSPDGRWFATADRVNSIDVWEGKTGQKAKSINVAASQPLSTMAFTRDGHWLMANGQFLDFDSGTLVRKLGPSWPNKPILMYPDGSWGAWVDPGSLAINVSEPLGDGSQSMADWLNGHTRAIGALALSPDGNLLASWGADDTVRIWDTGGFAQKVAKANQAQIQLQARDQAWAAEQEKKFAAANEAAARAASAGLSLEEINGAAVVLELTGDLARQKESGCPITTEGYVTLSALEERMCQAKVDACGPCDRQATAAVIAKNPNYSYQVYLTALGSEGIAVSQKPGGANFYSDGKNAFFSRAGRASRQSTLLGDLESVTAALHRAAATALAGVGLSPGEKMEAATVSELAIRLTFMKAARCPVTTQGFVASAAFHDLACQSKSDACECIKDSDPLEQDPVYSYQFHVTALGGEIVALPKNAGPPSFYSDGEKVYFSRTGPASPQSTLIGNAESVVFAMEPASAPNDAEMKARMGEVAARIAEATLSPEEQTAGQAVSLLSMMLLALKEVRCPVTTQAFVDYSTLRDSVCHAKVATCNCGDDGREFESISKDPNYSYQFHLTPLDAEVIAVAKKPGSASFYSDGENTYFSRTGQASKQSLLLGSAQSVLWAAMMNLQTPK